MKAIVDPDRTPLAAPALCGDTAYYSDSRNFLYLIHVVNAPPFNRNGITTKRESRLDAAILLYQHGEVTLARAAELAGVHHFEFDAVLNAKGIPKTVDVESEKDLQMGVSLIKQFHKSNGGAKEA